MHAQARCQALLLIEGKLTQVDVDALNHITVGKDAKHIAETVVPLIGRS